MYLKVNFKHAFQGHHPKFSNTKVLSCSYVDGTISPAPGKRIFQNPIPKKSSIIKIYPLSLIKLSISAKDFCNPSLRI